MRSATVNDMVVSTVLVSGQHLPGVEHAQILSTEGASKAALVVTVKRVVVGTGAEQLTLEIALEGSNELANWHEVSGSTLAYTSLTGTPTVPTQATSVGLGAWAWIRVRYRLRSVNATYGSTASRVLLTSTLSVAD